MGLVARSTRNLKRGSRNYLLYYTFLSGLTVVDMEDLLEDIQVHMELEQGKNADFWQLFKPKQEQGALFSILKSKLEELPPTSGPSVDPVEPEGAPATRGGSW